MKMKKKFEKFFSLDCSLLILSDFNSKIDFYSEFQSILKIRFIKKLRKQTKKSVKQSQDLKINRLTDLGFLVLEIFFPKQKI